MTREELIELGKKIVNCEGTEEEIDSMYDLFSHNVPHPNEANLFYYSENYNARTLVADCRMYFINKFKKNYVNWISIIRNLFTR